MTEPDFKHRQFDSRVNTLNRRERLRERERDYISSGWVGRRLVDWYSNKNQGEIDKGPKGQPGVAKSDSVNRTWNYKNKNKVWEKSVSWVLIMYIFALEIHLGKIRNIIQKTSCG